MDNFIKEPFKNKNWDPSKGDFFSEKLIQEDRQYKKATQRKRIYVYFLAILHLLLLLIIVILF